MRTSIRAADAPSSFHVFYLFTKRTEVAEMREDERKREETEGKIAACYE